MEERLHGVVQMGLMSSAFSHIRLPYFFVRKDAFFLGFVEGRGMGSSQYFIELGGGLRNSDPLA